MGLHIKTNVRKKQQSTKKATIKFLMEHQKPWKDCTGKLRSWYAHPLFRDDLAGKKTRVVC